MNERSPLTYLSPASAGSWPRTNHPKSAGWQTVAGWFLLVLPLLAFALVWHRYAVNVAKWDDHALRAFLYYVDQETTLSGKIYQLFKQHNEHRIVYDRFVALLDYALTGKLNFRHLMVLGNLSLAGLLALFTAILRRHGRSVLYAVPVAWLLFNLSQWENMFWGMAALQNFSVVLWVLAALYLLTYTSRWGLALVPAVLATLTSGNGLMVWPIGLVLLALRMAEPRPRTTRPAVYPLLSWLAASLIVVGLYFVGFKKPDDINYVRPGLSVLVKGWLAVIGSAGEALPFGRPLPTSTGLGALLTLGALGVMAGGLLRYHLAIGRIVRQLLSPMSTLRGSGVHLPPLMLFCWGSLVFMLATAAIVAWARTGFGIDLLITSRYKIYSLTLLSLLYVGAVAWLEGRGRQWVLGLTLAGSMAFAWLSHLSFLDETIWWRHYMLIQQFNWTFTTNSPVTGYDTSSKQYTDAAPAFYDAGLSVIFGPVTQPLRPLSMIPTPRGYRVSNTTLPKPDLLDAGSYIMARSAKRTYLFPVWQHQQSFRRAMFMPGRLFIPGFDADVWFSDLTAGTYRLFILTLSAQTRSADAQYTVYPTNQTVTSVAQPANTTKNW